MTPHEILGASGLDLLFDGRNKLYGAYALRRGYAGRLRWALVLGLGAPLGLLLLISGIEPEAVVPDRYQMTDVEVIQPPVIENPEIQDEQPAVREVTRQETATQQFTSQIQFVDEINPERVVPDAGALENRQVGSQNAEGPDVLGVVAPPAVAAPAAPIPPVEEAPVAPPAPDVAPAFPGGTDAWRAFLLRHLQSPEGLEPGERRQVLVKFEVDASGTVSHFEVVRTAGPAFDREVLRVFRKMPRWTPARYKGQAVATTFTQPVVFEGTEE